MPEQFANKVHLHPPATAGGTDWLPFISNKDIVKRISVRLLQPRIISQHTPVCF
jgi:hypothetical protein